MGSLGMVLAWSPPHAWDSHCGLGHSESLWNAWGSLKPPLKCERDSLSFRWSLQHGGGSLLSCLLSLSEGGIQWSPGLLQGDELGNQWHLRNVMGTQ